MHSGLNTTSVNVVSFVGQTPTSSRAFSLQKNHLSLDSDRMVVSANYRRIVRGKGVLKELKVFVADDSDAVIQQLQRAISLIAGCKLIGTAAGNNEATELIRNLQPDVVIIDISMPHKEGIDVLRKIRKEVPLAEVIIFTADPSVILQDVCLEAGADYYLHKTQIQDLIDICSRRLPLTG